MSKEFKVVCYDFDGEYHHEVTYDTLEEAEEYVKENEQDYNEFEIFECIYTLIKTI